MFYKKVMTVPSLVLLVSTSAFAAMNYQAAKPPNDSQEVSALLSNAKTEAIQLRDDADQLKAFTHSSLSWQTHAGKVDEIKEHVNNSGKLLTSLERAEESASAWQRQAIDRIRPLLEELASSVESTIDHLNQKPALLQTGPYAGYAAANYDLASNLAGLISDYVEYGKSKANAEELGSKLEVTSEPRK